MIQITRSAWRQSQVAASPTRVEVKELVHPGKVLDHGDDSSAQGLAFDHHAVLGASRADPGLGAAEVVPRHPREQVVLCFMPMLVGR